MECVEAKAFKTSLWRPEMLVKSSSNHHDEEVSKFSLWGSSNNNGGTPTNGDETFVDDLLDFSNEETVKENEEEDDYETVVDDNNSNTEMMKTVFSPEKNSSASLKNDFASVFASELSVPTDDLADLEWLSHFVEDSFSEEFSQTQYNDGNPTVLAVPKPQYQVKTEPEKKQQFIKTEAIETVGYYGFSPQPPPPTTTTTTAAAATTVPGKARSKRSRTGGRVWSLGYSTLTETSSSSTSTTTTTSSTTSSSSSYLIFNNIMRSPDYLVSLRKPPVIRHKKQRVVNGDDNGGCGGGGARVVRTQCSHCGVQKTPQWRTGPLGAKTLCNACGVRFKSGRLLPEYRPASSPTFSKAVHSNSHRKVLEIRKKKEVVAAPEAGFTSAVHSF